MKKLVLLVCVFVLLIVATGAASAKKPAPEQFTITGYTINDPFTDPDSVMLPNGNWLLHFVARGGGDDAAYDGTCATYGFSTCEEACMAQTGGQACGVSGYFPKGKFTFEEWVEFDPLTYSSPGNTGVIHITMPAASNSGSIAVVRFEGTPTPEGVSGTFMIKEQEGKGKYKKLSGDGEYTGNGDFVFSVTFTGDLKLKG